MQFGGYRVNLPNLFAAARVVCDKTRPELATLVLLSAAYRFPMRTLERTGAAFK